MIKILKKVEDLPYKNFYNFYEEASKKNQKSIEAIAVSSYLDKKKEVNSRFVNLKYIDEHDFIFFSNYESKKAKEFINNPNISILIYWSVINLQIRMKAKIRKTTKDFNQFHFKSRDLKKNALAISSQQSKKINKYEDVIEKFNAALEREDLDRCPDYWGGYAMRPYYFEFWKGNKSRLNKRVAYLKKEELWEKCYLEP